VTDHEYTPASDVASAAWGSVFILPARRRHDTTDDVLADEALEAAALLREGWSPGDPVEVRRG
jgi:hypothetical protein